jgi:hypothetical protein
MALSVAIKAAKDRDKIYKLADAGGLFLMVTPSGGRRWQMSYRYLDRQKLLSFGVWPDTGLAEAREKRDAARKVLPRALTPLNKTNLHGLPPLWPRPTASNQLPMNGSSK